MAQKWARTVGIAVDHRRTNTSVEQLQVNVARLVSYKAKLIVFPLKEGQPKKGYVNDATAEQVAAANSQNAGNFPITKAAVVPEFRAVTADMKSKTVYRTLRILRKTARYQGRRDKKAKDEEAAKK
jgi:large subunit ribosomal protein L13e